MAANGWPGVALLLAAAALGRQPGPEADPNGAVVARLIARLDGGTFRERQAAASGLVQQGLAARPAVMQALRAGKSSPETLARLRFVADQLHGFETLGPFDEAKDAKSPPRPDDLICLIDHDDDYRRYRRAIPALPAEFDGQFHRWQLLLVVVWDTRPRVVLRPTEDGDTLVLHVAEGQMGWDRTGDYRPPKYLLARVAAWPGSVRVTLNGQPRFTRWKGQELADRAAGQWAEIVRLHGGGAPTAAQRAAAVRPSWGATPDAVIAEGLAGRPVERDELRALFELEFRKLADMRATAVVDKIVALAETFREFDPAFEGAWHALAALGGPEVVAGCAKAARSSNRFAQHLASLVARDQASPEFRPVFHLGLGSTYDPANVCAMDGLTRLGWTEQDVAAVIDLLGREGTAGHVQVMAISHLGRLGRKAAPALPTLEKLKTHPFDAVREAAAQASAKIAGAP